MLKMEKVLDEQKSQLPLYFSSPSDTIEENNTSQNQKMHYKAVSSEKSRNSITPTDVQDVKFES